MNEIRWVRIVWTAALVLSLSGSLAQASDNIDPTNTGAQYAWGENIGWLNAEPSGDGGPGVFVEDDGVSGYLWSENTGWVSLSCLNNSTCGTSDYGVSNDGDGNLAGYAWSENLGWISFSCSNTNACATKNYGVTIDPATGEFSGRAWSENTGWISFRNQSGNVSYGVTTSWTNGGGGVVICDVNEDQSIDRTDIRLISAARNTPASGPNDPRDFNGDGIITVNDARGCVLQCTNSRCAP
ncbi:MAG: hypothetical protein K0U66_04315 [Gammaproteobacteria bacterium]|nr:hypothetical protein [Gammaproteobacteria bacterium]